MILAVPARNVAAFQSLYVCKHAHCPGQPFTADRNRAEGQTPFKYLEPFILLGNEAGRVNFSAGLLNAESAALDSVLRAICDRSQIKDVAKGQSHRPSGAACGYQARHPAGSLETDHDGDSEKCTKLGVPRPARRWEGDIRQPCRRRSRHCTHLSRRPSPDSNEGADRAWSEGALGIYTYLRTTCQVVGWTVWPVAAGFHRIKAALQDGSVRDVLCLAKAVTQSFCNVGE